MKYKSKNDKSKKENNNKNNKYDEFINMSVPHRYNLIYNGSVEMDKNVLKGGMNVKMASESAKRIKELQGLTVEFDMDKEYFTTSIIGIHEDTNVIKHPIREIHSITTYGDNNMCYLSLDADKCECHHYECLTHKESIEVVESGRILFLFTYNELMDKK